MRRDELPVALPVAGELAAGCAWGTCPWPGERERWKPRTSLPMRTISLSNQREGTGTAAHVLRSVGRRNQRRGSLARRADDETHAHMR